MERCTPVADAHKHVYLAQGDGTQGGVVGAGVVGHGYPDDGTRSAVQGVECGVDAAGCRIVDVFLAVDGGHMLDARGGLLETEETVSYGTVAHLAQAGSIDGGKSAVGAFASLGG